MPTFYTVDASVVVKWLHHAQEEAVTQARMLLQGALEGMYALVSSDVLTHEVGNALLRGKGLTGTALTQAIELFFTFPIELIPADRFFVTAAAAIAEKHRMTFYDAIYVAIAYERRAPLITANMRHQGKFGKQFVLDIATWDGEDESLNNHVS